MLPPKLLGVLYGPGIPDSLSLPLLSGVLHSLRSWLSTLPLALISIVFSTKNICTSMFHKVSTPREEW